MSMRARAIWRQPRLLRQGVNAAERRHPVFAQRDTKLPELLDEGAPSAQAGKRQVEPRAVEQAAERHELVFRTAAHQRRHHLQDAGASHEAAATAARRARAGIGASAAAIDRAVLCRATASPAMVKK